MICAKAKGKGRFSMKFGSRTLRMFSFLPGAAKTVDFAYCKFSIDAHGSSLNYFSDDRGLERSFPVIMTVELELEWMISVLDGKICACALIFYPLANNGHFTLIRCECRTRVILSYTYIIYILIYMYIGIRMFVCDVFPIICLSLFISLQPFYTRCTAILDVKKVNDIYPCWARRKMVMCA